MNKYQFIIHLVAIKVCPFSTVESKLKNWKVGILTMFLFKSVQFQLVRLVLGLLLQTACPRCKLVLLLESLAAEVRGQFIWRHHGIDQLVFSFLSSFPVRKSLYGFGVTSLPSPRRALPLCLYRVWFCSGSKTGILEIVQDVWIIVLDGLTQALALWTLWLSIVLPEEASIFLTRDGCVKQEVFLRIRLWKCHYIITVF